jgi:hypothetical protein
MKEQILVFRKIEDNDIDVINSKIPPEASPENQMADKEYVDSSIDIRTDYQDVYIGVADVSSTIIDPAYHHDRIVRGRPISFSNANGYLWVVLPQSYAPVFLMSGIEIPVSVDDTITIDDKAYNIYKSANAYNGTFNIFMF